MSDNMVSAIQSIIERINGRRNTVNRPDQPTAASQSEQQVLHLFVDASSSGKQIFTDDTQVFILYQDTHICGICSQKFADVLTFLHHKMEHSLGQQLYICELCSSLLSTESELAGHYISHHNLSFNSSATTAPNDQNTPKVQGVKDLSQPANGIIGDRGSLSSPVIQDVRLSDGSEAVRPKTNAIDQTESVAFSSGDETKATEAHGSSHSRTSVVRSRGPISSSGARRSVDGALTKYARHPTAVISVYPCPMCGKVFRCRRYLRKHSETHGSAHACDVCGKNYRSRAYLRLHRRRHEKAAATAAANSATDTVPTPPRPRFSCTECSFTSDVIAAIHAHRQVHAPSGSVRCAVCGRAYSNRAALSKHRRVHDTDRPFACPVPGCRWRFRTDVMCRAHVLAHTVAGRFRCSTCGYVFRRKHHLQRHEARMHQPTPTSVSTASRSASTVTGKTADTGVESKYHTTDVLLSSLNDSALCSPSDIYDTADMITDDDGTYTTLIDVSSELMCDKKSGNFIVDDLELF